MLESRIKDNNLLENIEIVVKLLLKRLSIKLILLISHSNWPAQILKTK